MCGICGVINKKYEKIPAVVSMVDTMNNLIVHRGPDGEGTWFHHDGLSGLAIAD